jgi:hypothetical protein
MCQAACVADFRTLAKSTGQNAVAKNNANVYTLQGGLGYIIRRTKSDSAVIRYAKFSQTDNSEKFYMTLLKLYLPHRSNDQLKPYQYETYEDFYQNGAVRLTPDAPVKAVKMIVEENRARFDRSDAQLEAAWDLLREVGPLEDAWSQVAPQNEQDRLDAANERVPVDDVHELENGDIPELNDNARQQANDNNRSLCSVELMSESVKPLLRQLIAKQKEVFYFVRNWCLETVQGKEPAAWWYGEVSSHKMPLL